jgi:tRNA 5-methylaminomethyl-2-thiouridine biosynthesis bifunctional protein
MANPYTPLTPARAGYDSRGILKSVVYDDVYHSGSGAYGQAEHVFLHGNRLAQRWRGRRGFTVCETGFGLGRNFLALWDAWRNDAARSSRLHVVSFEAHPFPKAELARFLLADIPDRLRPLGEALVAAWPALLPGVHRLEFEAGALTLTLAFGPVQKLARQIDASVDAYFLDGFSPARNPDMWSAGLFGQLVRMAAKGATAASWCCASRVRKALSDAGFLVNKAPGFGAKREMMVATLRAALGRDAGRHARVPAIVVGGGIAGAGVAYGLACRGHPVTVVDPAFAHGRGANQRGHLAVAMTPLVARDDNFRARLSRAGLACAARRWANVQDAPTRCGTLDLACTVDDAREKRSTLRTLGFPDDWVRWVDRAEAAGLAGVQVPHGAVYFSEGRRVRPEPLLESLLGHDLIQCRTATVSRLRQTGGGAWSALAESGVEIAAAPVLVAANASAARALLARSAGPAVPYRVASIENVAGQVSYFDAVGAAGRVRANLAGNGYWLPAAADMNVAGGTYECGRPHAAVTAGGHRQVADKAAALLGVDADELLGRLGRPSGWAGMRAVATERLPVIGQVPEAEGLWVACGYASRGFTWSALAGDVIAAHLNAEPVPLERELLRAVSPA